MDVSDGKEMGKGKEYSLQYLIWRTDMSSILNNLKFVSANRQNTTDPIQFRRNKLNAKLEIQIEMAKAIARGESFTQAKRMKKVTDQISGETTLQEVSKRVKAWWFTNNETKKVAVQLFYGNKAIAFNAKGDKNAVEVASVGEVADVLVKLQEAVLDGSLDVQIAQAADSVKARFAK